MWSAPKQRHQASPVKMFYARQAPGGRTLLDRPSHNIQQLAPLAAASLSAGHSVHSFAYAVVQCCENSLDAHAASVTVTIDLGRLTARVVDDGQGIPVASFPLLGQRNCGSKQQAAAQQVHSSTDASAGAIHDCCRALDATHLLAAPVRIDITH